MSRLWHTDWLTHLNMGKEGIILLRQNSQFLICCYSFYRTWWRREQIWFGFKNQAYKAIFLIIFISTKQCNFIAKRMFPQSTIYVFYLPWLHIAQKCVLFRNAEVQGREKWILMIFQPIGHPDLLIIRRQLSIQAFNVEVRYDRSRFPCSHYRPSHWLCQLNQEHVHKLMEKWY